jgi:heavy metal translocating P-type ATPase
MREEETGASNRHRDLAILCLVPAVVGVLAMISWALAHWGIGPAFANDGLALVATVFGGFQRFVSGFKDIFHRRITVNVFVAVALGATLAIGEFRPAAMIVFIMAVAGALESYTLDRTKKSIQALLDFAPKTASIRRGDKEVAIPVSDIQVGDVAVVRPGERIPVDGLVTTGASSVNQAPITGESMPVEKSVGAEVFAGTLNESGRLDIWTTKVGKDTTLSRIVHLVREAQETRAPIQNIADNFTAWFLPTVMVLAIIGFVASRGDIHVAVSILLVACPCAFAIATPTAVTAGVSNMARQSVLIKGGKFLELAQKIDTLLVDKTGTFTFGRPRVMDMVAFDGLSPDDVLFLAATAEKYSEHPLARAILAEGKRRGLNIPDPEDFEIKSGMGVMARHSSRCILVGNPQFLENEGIAPRAEFSRVVAEYAAKGMTAVLIAVDGRMTGALALADEIRPEVAQSIASLKAMGIGRIVMLTGDNKEVAQSVAKQIGVDDFEAGLLPEDKLEQVRKLRARGELVGMIGDGINDAPALALADMGIAMGAAGTDVAIETADVTLMNDNLTGVVDFVWMSGKVIRRIKLNIFFSIIYNVIGLSLGLVGMLTPIHAVFFQEAGCITVVLSSTLLLWAKRK